MEAIYFLIGKRGDYVGRASAGRFSGKVVLPHRETPVSHSGMYLCETQERERVVIARVVGELIEKLGASGTEAYPYRHGSYRELAAHTAMYVRGEHAKTEETSSADAELSAVMKRRAAEEAASKAESVARQERIALAKARCIEAGVGVYGPVAYWAISRATDYRPHVPTVEEIRAYAERIKK